MRPRAGFLTAAYAGSVTAVGFCAARAVRQVWLLDIAQAAVSGQAYVDVEAVSIHPALTAVSSAVVIAARNAIFDPWLFGTF